MAKKDNHYIYTPDPFASFKYNKQEDPVKEEKVLSRTALDILLKSDEIEDNEKFSFKPTLSESLNKYRLSLLFQLFANGMRISDLLLLRWNNIESYQLKYKMFKTKRSMIMPLNTNLIIIICKVIPDKGRMLSYYNRYKNGKTKAPVIIDNQTVNLNLTEVEKILNDITINRHDDGRKQQVAKRDGYAEVDGYYIEPKNLAQYYTLKNARNYLISQVEYKMALDLTVWNKDKKNDFIFPFLKNEDFANIDEKNDFSKISEPQYKKIIHAEIVYNRNLDKIAEVYGFDNNFSSHSARHSFASYLLNMGNVNTFDIQQLLGHTNLQITDKYLRKHFNIGKLDDTNRRLSNENTIL